MIAKNSALIVIDVQNQFVSDLGPEMKATESVEKIKQVIDIFRKKQIPIIFFREIHRKQKIDFGRELDGTESIHCIEGTHAAELVDGIEPLANEYRIDKRRYSCFFKTDLEILLKGLGVNTLYIIGYLTDVCVHYTCADAHQLDYHVRVVEEAPRGSTWDATKASINAIQYLQRDSIIHISDLK